MKKIYCARLFIQVSIPPYGSKDTVKDPFLEIQEVRLKHDVELNNISLFGNFNSRSGALVDYVHTNTSYGTDLV